MRHPGRYDRRLKKEKRAVIFALTIMSLFFITLVFITAFGWRPGNWLILTLCLSIILAITLLEFHANRKGNR